LFNTILKLYCSTTRSKERERERKVDLLDKRVKRKIRRVSRSQKGKREVREKEYTEEEE